MSPNRGVQVLLRKEFLDVKKNPRSEFFQVYDLVRSHLQQWEIYVIGPPDTPYHGGVYKAVMSFPDEYPMKPPSIRFMCQMLHPNIYKDGKVCISTLQTGQGANDMSGVYWRPVLGVEQAILSVISLLSDPNLDDPANTGAANLYKMNRAEFNERCKQLAERSMKHVPKDFEYPVVVHKKETVTKKIEIKETRKPADDEGFEYDLEDVSSDEDDDDEPVPNTHEKVTPLRKKDDEDRDPSSGGSGSKGVMKKAFTSTSAAAKSESKSEGGQGDRTNQGSGEGTNQANLSVLDLLEMDHDPFTSRSPTNKKQGQLRRISMGISRSLKAGKLIRF